MNPKPAYDTLILEGGSLRCAFTAGVMDALLLLGPLKFDRIFGISAGSMVMATYLSGQYKHFYRISRDLVEDGTFIRFSSAWSKEGLMNLSHLRAHVMRHAPLDLDALGVAQETTQAIVVTTHLETGKPRYIEPQGRDWMDALVASSSLPIVTRGKVKFRGEWMFDGGYSDPLPLDKAIEMGGRHIFVVRTRPMGDHAYQSYVDSFGMYWHRQNKVLAPLFWKATSGTTTRSTACFEEATTTAELGRRLHRPIRFKPTRGPWVPKKWPKTTDSAWTRR